MKTYEQFISENSKPIYLYNEIDYFVDWFDKFYSRTAQIEGWGIFISDSDYPKNWYKSNDKFGYFWQIERLDEKEILKDDHEADELAKEVGIMLDPYNAGVVIGFNNINFLENPERIKDACYINPIMEDHIKNWKMYKDTKKYNL